MIRLTAIWAAAILLTLSSSLVQAERWATIDGNKVHPSQLLAQLKGTEQGDRAALVQLLDQHGLRLVREYRLVPGLLLLSSDADEDSVTGESSVQSAGRYGADSTPSIPDNKLPALAQALRNSGLFSHVEYDNVSTIQRDPADSSYEDDTLWGLRNRGIASDGSPFGTIDADIDANLAWDLTTGSKDVIVGVIDTGVWYTHNDLRNQMWKNPGEIADNGVDDDENGWVDDVYGINTVVDTGDPLDDEGHGTHVAGVLGASANDDGDVVGVAWEVQIMALKAFDSFGFSVDSDQVQAIEYGVEHGCRILNASFGGQVFSQSVFNALAEAQTRNVLVVAAAGNEGRDADLFPVYPGAYNLDNIISVAAMNRFDQLADFSNFGLNNVDIAAPGEEIYSTSSGADDEYAELGGTSQATPYVAGVGALILSVFPELSVGEVRGRILSSAVKLPAYSGKVATGGRLNAFDAFDAAPDGALEIAVDPPSQTAHVVDSTLTIVVRVSDLFAVTDATVEGTIAGGTTIAFRNDGELPDVQGGDALYTGEVTLPDTPGLLEINLSVTSPGKEGIESLLRYVIVEPPSNDDFSSSVKLASSGGSVVTSTTFATFQADEPQHAGVLAADHTLWWTWTPAEDTVGFIDTSGSGFDTVVAVYTGNRVDELVEIASINNVGSKQDAFLFFPAQRGVGYRIAIGGSNADESGTLRFRLEPNGEPDLVLPVVNIDSPVSGIVSLGNRIEISGTAFDPSPNASGISAVILRVNNQAADNLATGTTEWTSSAFLTPGENTIQALARDFAGNISASEPIRVTYFIADPPNDHFANAEVLEGLEGATLGNNSDATKQAGEPLHAGNLGGGSLWYSFTAPEDGVLDLRTRGSNFDTLLAIYTGEKVADLDFIAANDDVSGAAGVGISQLVQAVRGGVEYSIAVDGFSDQSGRVNLAHAFTAGGVFDVVVESGEGGEVVPGSGLRAAGAEVTYLAVADSDSVFVGWEGSVTSSENPLVVTVDQDLELTAVFAPLSRSADFETGDFSSLGFSFAGSQPWSVTDVIASTGEFAARSGAIEDNESSSLILNFVSPGGRGSFDYAVSSEEGWDFLEFFVNGARRGRWSGLVDWQSFEFTVPSGDVELEWRYSKDFANAGGADVAIVDNVDVPIGEPLVPASRLSVVQAGNRGIKLEMVGEPGVEYLIEVSQDLENWAEFATGVSDSSGTLRFGDSDSTGTSARFFRAIAQ